MTTTYAVDLVTFYNPLFWGLNTEPELNELAEAEPEKIWTTIFATLRKAGIAGIEMTFHPFGSQTALAAFGTAAAFGRTLAEHELRVVSGFWLPEEWTREVDIGRLESEADQYASFLAELGANAMAANLGRRSTFGSRPERFADLRAMEFQAEIAHRVGAVAARHGITFCAHTESSSLLWYSRDIDLFLTLTDPEYVSLCIDTAHITLGGGDPIAIARRYASRVALAHWKDAVGRTAERLEIDDEVWKKHRPFMADMGHGVVDWSRWVEAIAKTRANQYVLLELDAAADPLTTMVSARGYLETLPEREHWSRP